MIVVIGKSVVAQRSAAQLKLLAVGARYQLTTTASFAQLPFYWLRHVRRSRTRILTVEFNRNQFFMAGVFLVLLGIQFRLVDSATLNEKTTRFLASHSSSAATSGMLAILPSSSVPKKVIHPPQWLGWSLVSVGAVCILHSLAMKRPGG